MRLALEASIARIQTPAGKPIGGGFLVNADWVLTCAHVIAAATGLTQGHQNLPQTAIHLDFPLAAPNVILQAQVAFWQPQDDVAGLKLESAPSSSMQAMPLAPEEDLWGHPFRTFGFPAGHEDGVWASGVLRGSTGSGWIQIEDVKETGYLIAPGFSGAPVWDETIQSVVGIVVAAERQPGVRAAFLIPASTLTQAYPTDDCPPPTSKIANNPFGDAGRITDPVRFFDREELLRQIFEELDKGVNVSLVGDSQIGKSSLLSMVCTWGPDKMTSPPDGTAYLNLEWVDDEDDFYEALCDALGIKTCRGFKLTRALRGKRIILCLDEIEKMAWEGFTVKVRSQLRGLADGPNAPLKLVIASRSPLFHLFPDSPELDSPLAGICRQLDVTPFSPKSARTFLNDRLHDTGVRFTASEIQSLVHETDGHPAKLQRAAANLYSMKTRGS
jgi:hypothetical protein